MKDSVLCTQQQIPMAGWYGVVVLAHLEGSGSPNCAKVTLLDKDDEGFPTCFLRAFGEIYWMYLFVNQVVKKLSSFRVERWNKSCAQRNKSL
ncbi:MAG TPA: hypothetical protein PK395_12730 [bacterium]|nr:hypothetical protein [bacterium]HQP99477.1 hypothetical protein [bacterium]